MPGCSGPRSGAGLRCRPLLAALALLPGSALADEALVPCAWGVNACASVVGAIAATLAAIHFGFTAVLLAAIVLYFGAALSAPIQASANPS